MGNVLVFEKPLSLSHTHTLAKIYFTKNWLTYLTLEDNIFKVCIICNYSTLYLERALKIIVNKISYLPCIV